MESDNCEVVQLHGNLDFFRCSYCANFTEWDAAYAAALASGKVVPCPSCASGVEERRNRGQRTNVHVGHLRPNIVLFDDVDDPLSQRAASLIDDDAESSPDALLILGTSLKVDGPSRELKNRLVPATHRNGGQVVYINNQPPPKAFRKPVTDHAFEMDCDVWVQDLATREASLWVDEGGQRRRRPPLGFHFRPEAKTVEEVIRKAESKLISIGDYTDVQFRTRTKEQVREDLSPFLPQQWLSTSPLLCVLSLFGWAESTFILHSKHMHFDVHDTQKRREMLEGPVWPIGRNHTRIVIPYNPGGHWILIEADVQDRVIRYYDSLPGTDLGPACEYVTAQLKRVSERLGRSCSAWSPPVDGVSATQLFVTA